MPERYSIKHSGACLLVGYAPDVHSDVAAARALRPEAPMLGVKYAASLYPEIEHVWTQHLEQADEIKRRAGRRIFVHARPRGMQRKWGSIYVFGKNDIGIDYEWPELAWVGASSGISAAMWARHGMGFDEVILCGVPLEPGGYAQGVAAFKPIKGDGGKSFVDTGALKYWRECVEVYRKQGKTEGIRSMSGWTREALGAPA